MCWGVITWTDDNFFPLVAHFQPGLMMLFGGASQFATAVHRLPAIQGHLVGGHFNSTARWFVRHRGGGDGENILKIPHQGSEARYKVRGGRLHHLHCQHYSLNCISMIKPKTFVEIEFAPRNIRFPHKRTTCPFEAKVCKSHTMKYIYMYIKVKCCSMSF